MLATIFIVLFASWTIGLLSAITFGGYINILLVMAAIILLIRIMDSLRVE